ncbi:elongation factor P hydroxylase [Thalassotalea euphylliae]|uniref:Elongation factor P hydroxylase n=1 Tax=Thalassotalea euphylliae TaxID=1655234 RepID=A0A3E0TSM8_9GAMM|nr:elongation factor P hydroxylase [Thalassotalea euphylliae]REL27646.1 elongation factor P hydroxylase [Thalassotalea euphylliae]
MHQIDDIISIFNNTFFESFNTKLVKGDDEPIYLPADDNVAYHRIVFAHGFYASALHEIAHWCIAGPKRRLLEDFGYWYEPDGRDEAQQKAFEKVEIKPQAVEWALCAAAGKTFRVSADNLDGAEPDYQGFKNSVFEQVKTYLSDGFPTRAQQLMTALCAFYQTTMPNHEQDFLKVSP